MLTLTYGVALFIAAILIPYFHGFFGAMLSDVREHRRAKRAGRRWVS